MRVDVSSEIGKLNKVMIHRPDNGLENILVTKLHDWLYDDIVDIKQMQREYDHFLVILLLFLEPEILFDANDKFNLSGVEFDPAKENFYGIQAKNVLDTQYLLQEIFRKDHEANGGRHTIGLVEQICAIEGVHSARKLDLIKLYETGNFIALANTLLSGELLHEWKVEDRTVKPLSKPIHIFPPIPNLMFTRDIGVSINDYMLITKPRYEIRKREVLLQRFICELELFKETKDKIIEISEDDNFFQMEYKNMNEKSVNYEGGDIMMISKHHLLVGCSERTSTYAISKLVHRLFKERTDIELVSVIKISPKRSQMHIDTIMSQIKKNVWILFGHLSEALEEKERYQDYYTQSLADSISQKTDQEKKNEQPVTIVQFYKPSNEEYNKKKNYGVSTLDYEENSPFRKRYPAFSYTKPLGLENLLRQISVHDYGVKADEVMIIYSGDQKFPHDEREQLTDACNLLILREGIAIGYDRNYYTGEAFAKFFDSQNNSDTPPEKAGYWNFLQSRYEEYEKSKAFHILNFIEKPNFTNKYVMRSHDFLSYIFFLEDKTDILKFITEIKDTLIVLPSNELSRARGGSHCMSMPLMREHVI